MAITDNQISAGFRVRSIDTYNDPHRFDNKLIQPDVRMAIARRANEAANQCWAYLGKIKYNLYIVIGWIYVVKVYAN